jgi:hypothetical protein
MAIKKYDIMAVFTLDVVCAHEVDEILTVL